MNLFVENPSRICLDSSINTITFHLEKHQKIMHSPSGKKITYTKICRWNNRNIKSDEFWKSLYVNEFISDNKNVIFMENKSIMVILTNIILYK